MNLLLLEINSKESSASGRDINSRLSSVSGIPRISCNKVYRIITVVLGCLVYRAPLLIQD